MSFGAASFSGIDSSYSLPDNVALLTLQELDDGNVLLRLAHLYEVGEDKDLSGVASVVLKKLFRGKKICFSLVILALGVFGSTLMTHIVENRIEWEFQKKSIVVAIYFDQDDKIE